MRFLVPIFLAAGLMLAAEPGHDERTVEGWQVLVEQSLRTPETDAHIDSYEENE